jgi:hypothetical protein
MATIKIHRGMARYVREPIYLTAIASQPWWLHLPAAVTASCSRGPNTILFIAL